MFLHRLVNTQVCKTEEEEVCMGSKYDSYSNYNCMKVPTEVCSSEPKKECNTVTKVVTDYISVEECHNKDVKVSTFVAAGFISDIIGL